MLPHTWPACFFSPSSPILPLRLSSLLHPLHSLSVYSVESRDHPCFFSLSFENRSGGIRNADTRRPRSCNPFLLEWVAATCTLFLLRINSGTGRWIGFDSFLRFLSYDVTSHNFETILRTLYRKDRKENFPNRFRSLSRKILSSPSSIIIISNYLCTAIIIVHRFHQIRFNDTIEGNNIF